MSNARGFKCVECHGEHSQAEYVCPDCNGNLDVVYDYHAVAKHLTKESLRNNLNFTMWRYRPLLPVEALSAVPPLNVGWTPIHESPRLATTYGVTQVFIKDDGRNPTASFKDRPSALAVVKALEARANVVTTASSGNAGSALAGMCASVGLQSVIFVPVYAPAPKVAQLQIYGATVVLVDGNYDDAFELCLRASMRWGWYQRNTGYNPFTREGKKTAALEMAEQLKWKLPDKVFVAVGDGNIISGLWKGFRDLKSLQFIDRLPQMIAVQAERAAAIVNAANGDGKVRPGLAQTIADSINVGKPNDATMAIRAIRESSGCGITVSDDEMVTAISELARSTGVFAEPAAAAPFAAFKKMSSAGLLDANDRVLLMVTGNGLKDVDSARRDMSPPLTVKPDIHELERALKPLPGRTSA